MNEYPKLQIYAHETWTDVSSVLNTCVQTEMHLQPGQLNFTYDIDDDLLLAKDDRIALRVLEDSEDVTGVIVFSGKVRKLPIIDEQQRNAVALNVINELERLVYEAYGNQGSEFGPTHIKLFTDDTAGILTNGEQIKLALDYAVSQGVAVKYVQAELDALDLAMSSEEVTELTVAEVIKKSLLFRPDVIVSIQYDTTDPEGDQIIRFTDRDNLPSLSLSVTDCLSSFSADPLYDSQVSGVVINYTWKDLQPDGSYTSGYLADEAGLTSGVGVLRTSVPMQGITLASSTTASFTIPGNTNHHFLTYAQNSSFDYSTNLYTQYLYNFLVDLAVDSGMTRPAEPFLLDGINEMISVYIDQGWQITVTDPAALGDDYYILLPSEFSNIPDWAWERLTGQLPPQRLFYVRFRLLIGGTDSDPVYSYFFDKECRWVKKTETGYHSFTKNTYEAGEEIPVGIANTLFNALSPLNYAGSFLRELDLSDTNAICSILNKLNVTGTADDLTAMNAMIQACSTDYLNFTKNYRFGMADHLSPQDIVNFLRSNRERDFSLLFPENS